MRFAKQYALPQAVESRYAQTPGGLTVEQVVNPLAHFTGGLVGKGQCTNVLGRVSTVNQPGNFSGDDTGFTATGACQDQAGVVNTGHCLLLLRVEIFQVQGC
jgi:hypothetical protein